MDSLESPDEKLDRVFYGLYSAKLWDVLGKNNGIYWLKIVGYIWPTYGIRWEKL